MAAVVDFARICVVCVAVVAILQLCGLHLVSVGSDLRHMEHDF